MRHTIPIVIINNQALSWHDRGSLSCYDSYTQAFLERGSNIEELTEAVHVTYAIRGGASLAHSVQMRNVADKLSM